MSTRVYLSKHTCQTTHEEDTPVCVRIQLSRTTVKDLHSRLQHAYQRDDVRLVRRITVLLDLLVHRVPMAVLCERWGLSPSCIYAWQQAFLLRGMDSSVYGHVVAASEVDSSAKETLGRVDRGRATRGRL